MNSEVTIMMSFTKRKALPLIFFSALGCIGADAIPKDVDFYCGQFLYNRPLEYKVDYHEAEYPKFIFSWSVYKDEGKTELVSSCDPQFYTATPTETGNSYILEGSISNNVVLNLTSYYVEFIVRMSKGSYYDLTTKTYRVNIYSGQLSGPSIAIKSPVKGEIYSTSRYYGEMKAGILKTDVDSYYFANLPSGPSDYHGLQLGEFRFGYHDSRGDKSFTGLGELYIYTNPSDWNIGQLGVQNGKLYRKVPVTINYTYTIKKSGISFRMYRILLDREYAVDRYDAKMYPSIKQREDGERYLLTKDLFIPVRTGHDAQTYSFKLHLFNLSSYGDTIDYEFTAARSGSFFGSCTDAEYCVGLGS